MTLNDERTSAWAFECYICHRPFNRNKVRDHDQLTGKDRGAAHERCNLILRKTSKVPVFFRNLSGYDSHLIVWGSAHSLCSTSTSSAREWRSS